MKRLIFDVGVLMVMALGNSLAADDAGATAIRPIHTITVEPGVVSPGTSLVVLTQDPVKTNKAYRSTVYLASAATDILDQKGAVLIPKESPVELVVHSLAYLGPGGVGMTSLILDVEAVTVRNVRYPVETHDERPGAGGINVNRGAARWVGESGDSGSHVVTVGRDIDVPAGTLLAFRLQAPIRLRGYRR